MTRTVTVMRADAAGTQQRMRARIVDALPDARGDVALVDVDATDLPSATLAPAGEPTPGTPVTAVGTGPWGPRYGPATLPPDHPSGPLPAVSAEPAPERHHQ